MSLITRVRNYFKPATPSIEESFAWRYIDLDLDLVEEIKGIYLKNLKADLSQYEFFQVLPIEIPHVMGRRVIGAGFVYSKGNHTSKYTHKDPVVSGASTFALNIPLINCQDSRTTLYRNRKAPMYSFYGGRVAEIAKVSDCDPVADYTLDRPIMFNTQILHAVDNFSPDPRLAISLRFDQNPLEWI